MDTIVLKNLKIYKFTDMENTRKNTENLQISQDYSFKMLKEF